MNGIVAERIKIYHIIHISRLPEILAEKYLISDAEVQKRDNVGVTIGMTEIKRRRLEELSLSSHPGLYVGKCVPFYFCPRSVMLYMFHMRNHPDIEYQGGQEPILHLFADLLHTIEWAEQRGLRWAFTNSNAGSYYFDDFADIKDLNKLDWGAIKAIQWSGRQDKKQAEFLIEEQFPWELVEGIGVHSHEWVEKINTMLRGERHKPPIRPKPEWYY